MEKIAINFEKNDALEEMYEKVQQSIIAPQEITTLCIGGINFHATHATWTQYPGSFFEVLLSGRFSEPARLMDGSIFIDRDPSVFPVIMSYLKSKKWLRLDEYSSEILDALLIEADFYGLAELKSWVEPAKNYKAKQEEQRQKQIQNLNRMLEDLNKSFLKMV